MSTANRHVTKSLLVKSGRGEMKVLRRALGVLSTLGMPVSRRNVHRRRGDSERQRSRRCGATASHAGSRVSPEPRNLFLLELNLVANDLDRDVQICRAAIADVAGEVELLVSKRRSGLLEVHTSDAPLPSWTRTPYEVITVAQTTLDNLADQGVFAADDVGLLWMDAQGHKGHILRGGSSLTELGVPVVTELDPDVLRRHGALELVKEIAQTQYTHFVRMRQIRGGAGLYFDLDPTDELDDEIAWLTRVRRHTDILLIRDPRIPPEGGRATEAGDT